MKREQIRTLQKTCEEQIESHLKQVQLLEEEIQTQSRQIVDTETAVNYINEQLSAVGFCNFHLRRSMQFEQAYEVERADGSVAAALSEGEQRFLAFLYYSYKLRMDRETDHTTIVVMDDPFVGLDKQTSQIILQLIIELMHECIQADSKLEQLFLLTCHDAYFCELVNHAKGGSVQICTFLKKEMRSDIVLTSGK